MAISRYRKCNIINNKYTSIPVYNFDYSDDDVYYYITNSGDRFDRMAQVDFGDSEYWWILAKINKMSFMFQLSGSMQIKRVRNPNVFLDQI